MFDCENITLTKSCSITDVFLIMPSTLANMVTGVSHVANFPQTKLVWISNLKH